MSTTTKIPERFGCMVFNEETMKETVNLSSDLGLSSVGVLYVVIGIEEMFGIRFDDVGFSDFETLGDVMDYIAKKVGP